MYIPDLDQRAMAPGCACGRVSWHGRTVPGGTVAVRSCCGPLVRRWSGPADHAGRAGCARPDPQVTATGSRPVHPARWSPGRCRSPDQNERVGTQDRAAGRTRGPACRRNWSWGPAASHSWTAWPSPPWPCTPRPSAPCSRPWTGVAATRSQPPPRDRASHRAFAAGEREVFYIRRLIINCHLWLTALRGVCLCWALCFKLS